MTELVRIRDATQLTPQEEALFEQYLQDAGIGADTARIGPRPEPRDNPLSMAQERLWFLEQLAPGTATQHVPDARILRGPLVPAHFAASLAEVERRHEVMRMTVGSCAGQPHASLLPIATCAEELPIEFFDLRELPEAAREAAILDHGRELLARPFDLAGKRLWRSALLRTEEQQHIWFLVMHHLISDGTSLQILVREVASAYGALCAGQPPALPALPVQYADYAAWEARTKTPAALGSALTYWQEQLAGPLPLLNWPTGRPRPPQQRLRGATLRAPILARDRQPELQAASSRLSITPFSFLLAAYAALLQQVCSAEDVLIGTPASSREEPELEPLIGLFVDTLILRLRLAGCTTFADAAMQAHACLHAAQQHRVPLEQLVKVLNLPRDLSRPVLRQTAFAMQPSLLAEVAAGPLRIQPWHGHIDVGIARLDLTLFVSEDPQGLRAVWEYNTDLLDAEFVSALSATYERLVLALVAQPQIALGELVAAGQWGPPVRDESLLTEAQKLFWFSEKLASGTAMYFERVRAALYVDGSLDPSRLGASLAQAIRKSDALRSVIEVQDCAPVRRVRAELPEELLLVDLRGAPDSAEAAAAWMAQMAKTPLPAQERLLRAALLRLTDRRDVFYVELHHMVADLVSLRRLLLDVSASYKDCSATALPAVARPFAEFVDDELRYRQTAGYQRDARYWQKKLATEVTAARFYKLGNAQADTATCRLTLPLGGERTEALKRLMRRYGIFSPAIALKAVLFAYLRRVTGESLLRIGEPLAYRPEGFEDTMGLFVNICTLDVELTGHETFASLLAKVQAETLTVLRHQRYPLRHPPGRRLYEVYFNYQNASFGEFAGRPATFELLHTGHSHDLLTVQLQEFAGPGQLGLDVDFRVDAFNAAQRQATMGHFMRLLDAMLTDAEQPIDTVQILSASEQEALLHDYNDTARSYDLSLCLHELIDQQCAQTPDAIALRFEGDSLTYGELQKQADALARHLAAVDVGPDRVVGVYMERSLEMVVALLAVLKAGGAYLPLDPTYPAERLDYMMKDAALAAVLTQSHLRARLPEYSGPVLCVDGPVTPPSAPSASHRPRRPGPEHLAYVIYTSGSTGQPKGVAIPHRGICNRLIWMQEAYRLTAQDVVLQKTPFSFDVSVWEFFWPLLVGSTLVIARPGGHMDPEYLSQIIFREGVTVLHFVPSMLEVFLQQPLGGKVGSVRYVFCSGEALGYDLQQRFFAQMACELHNLYGPTEASVDVTAWRCDPGLHAGTVPIGFPIANTRVYILDVAGGLLPPGLIGEIYLAGTGLARGYLNKPELTAARFVERELAPQRHERLYRTLDLGRYRDDGSIEFLGRADSQIKLRGFRIELGEIESVLSRHPAVREVVVVVHQARAGDRRLVAYLVAAQAQEDLARSLRAHAQRYLPEYMVPAAFVALAQMPLSANGKVERRALPAPDWRLQAADGPASAAPGTALKQLLSELFAEVLGLPAVGCNDDFFRLGGHSLLATRVIARIGQILPMPVPLSLLFEATTVDSLAVRLEELWKSQNADLDLSQVLTAVLSMSDSEVEAQLLQLENS